MYISSQHSLKETQTLQDCLYKREVELKQQEEAVLDKQKLIAMARYKTRLLRVR